MSQKSNHYNYDPFPSFLLVAIEQIPILSWDNLGWNVSSNSSPKIDSPPVPLPVGSPP